MDNPHYYTKPLHLRIEGEEFDRVRGKTREQVMKDLEEYAEKVLEEQNAIIESGLRRLRKKWVREELAKIKEKKRKRRLARKARQQNASASS